jgi:hypothetical protein
MIRGLWITPLFLDIHQHYDGPLPSSTSFHFVIGMGREGGGFPASPPREWIWQTDLSHWIPSHIMQHHVFWTPNPNLDHQALSTAVMAWVEAPWYSSHVFMVPRLMQRDCGQVNKHILLVGHFWQLPLPSNFESLVHFFIYLPASFCALFSSLQQSRHGRAYLCVLSQGRASTC